jgi:hypothetical protein
MGVLGSASAARAITWSLAGGFDRNQSALVVGLSRGQALLCTPRDCQLFEAQTGAWTGSAAPGAARPNLAYARLRNGDVALVSGVVVQRRRADSGAWTAGASLPAELHLPQIEQQVDGRILLSSVDPEGKRLRTLVADEALTHWADAGELPATGAATWSLFSASLATRQETGGQRTLWRYHADHWREVPVADWSEAADQRVLALDSRTLLLMREAHGWRARVVDLTGATVASAFVPIAGALSPVGVTLAPGAPAQDATVLLTDALEQRSVLWQLGAPPVALPTDPMGVPHALVALEPGRYLGTGPSGTVQILSLDDHAPAGKPCDGLTAFLQRSFDDAAPVAPRRPNGRYAGGNNYPNWEKDMERALRARFPMGPLGFSGLVTPACREQASRGDAAILGELVRGWTRRPEQDWVAVGRVLACALHDRDALAALPAWMADADLFGARAVCTAELASWPEAGAVRDGLLATMVRKGEEGWEVDAAVVAVANVQGTPALRRMLVPVLQAARARRAIGYDRLRRAVCEPVGNDAWEAACTALPAGAEDAWRQRGQTTTRTLGAAGATVLVGGAIVGAYVQRDRGVARGIATGAGALTGAGLGLALAGLAVAGGGYSRSGDGAGGLMLFGTVAGAALGGVAAYALASSPRARAPVTAGGLVLPYVVTLAFVFE